MAQIKLVLTDFDGTVVQFGKHVVSERVRQAVITCEEKGIRMVPVTGRYYEMARPVLEVLGFEDLGIFDNGATIQNCKTGEIVWSQWMDAQLTKQVARICAPAARLIDYTSEHDEHEPADNEIERIKLIAEPASHVYAIIKDDELPAVIDQLKAIPGIAFYTAASTREGELDARGIQINHIEADKFHGVNALREIIGIPMNQTLAIGDGENDVALFKNASLKIAMGNADEVLKAKADHVVSTVYKDGFVEAMNKFVLN
jgi:HAD superfamily hydrolase (TIGR01484 family)